VPGNPKEVKLKGFSGFPEVEEIVAPTKSKAATKQYQKASKRSKFYKRL
jgi:hypothetical protein